MGSFMKNYTTIRRMILPSMVTVLISMLPFCSVQAGYFSPSNLWECILKKMPDADNDRTANDIHRQCEKEFPNTEEYEQDVWRMFGPETFEECTSDYLTQTRSMYGRTMLRHACYRLFSKGKKP